MKSTEDELHKLTSWFNANFVKPNQSKTKAINLGKKNLLFFLDNPNVSLIFDKTFVCIERVDQYLEVLLDETTLPITR